MRFLRHNQFLLLTVAVLVFASVMVIRQFLANQSAHTDRREDLIVLHERGETKAEAWLYQRLIQELPSLSDRSLVDDLERTSALVDTRKTDLDNLLWKYYVSVKKEVERRAQRRLERIIAQSGKP
jgi:hypothetical protein